MRLEQLAARDLCSVTSRLLPEVETTSISREIYLHCADADSLVWPQTISHFYLGVIPLVVSSVFLAGSSKREFMARSLYPLNREDL